MAETQEFWIMHLVTAPKLSAIVDQQIDLFAQRYHKMLRAIAGYIGSTGWLSPCIRDTEYSSPSDDIESILNLVIEDLQDAGIIPKAAWYKPVAWYVLHFIVIPFLRAVLTQSHYPVK